MKLLLLKKIGAVFIDVLIYTFLVVSILLATLVLITRLSGNETTNLFGYELRTVATNSMEECSTFSVDGYEIKSLPKNTLIIIEKVPLDNEKQEKWYNSLKEGDVLTFSYAYVRQEIITHRITKIIEKKTGGYVIELTGDNRVGSDTPLTQIIDTSLIDTPNYVIGKVVKSSKIIGNLIVSLKNPVTMVFSLILPSLIIIMYQIFKIILTKMEEKIIEKDEEILRLKTELNKK